jgi:hypothetical protein
MLAQTHHSDCWECEVLRVPLRHTCTLSSVGLLQPSIAELKQQRYPKLVWRSQRLMACPPCFHCYRGAFLLDPFTPSLASQGGALSTSAAAGTAEVNWNASNPDESALWAWLAGSTCMSERSAQAITTASRCVLVATQRQYTQHGLDVFGREISLLLYLSRWLGDRPSPGDSLACMQQILLAPPRWA